MDSLEFGEGYGDSVLLAVTRRVMVCALSTDRLFGDRRNDD